MIERELHDDVALVRMVRGKGNSMSTEFLAALSSEIEELAASATRAVVLTGEGRVFSAGVDLPAVAGGGAEYLQAFLPALSEFLSRLAQFPKPIVAAVNGHAIAGGCIGMLACDYRVLVDGHAKVGLTELLVGVPFPSWPLEIARFAIPMPHFARLVYTGETISPREALAWGLVDELAAAEHVVPRALEVAARLAKIPTDVFRFTKRQLRRPLVEAVERAVPRDDAQAAAHWSTPETLQNIRAFAERTIARGS